MPTNAFLTMYKEPRVPGAPRRVRRDWALLGVLVPTAIMETIFRPDIEWRWFSLAWFLAIVPTLLWRRTEPLLSMAAVFGSVIVISLVSLVVGTEPIGLYTMAFVLILPYSLNRWGSGREMTIGIVLLVGGWATGTVADYTGIGEAIGGFIFLMFPAEFGAMVRYQSNARYQAIEQAKAATRQQLARELHDTVAHHVSAIVIQAQGGQATAASDPNVAAEVLAVIEEEASRALVEMRNVVGALRDEDGAELSPQPGIADIERLADIGGYLDVPMANGTANDAAKNTAAADNAATNGRTTNDIPRIDVEMDGNLEGLRPSVDTAVYRVAQESITNVLRHARQASRVLVRVVGTEESVRLTVEDDGLHNPAPRGSGGFGLVGMEERVALLGGSLDAGPNGRRGWTVDAVLPRT